MGTTALHTIDTVVETADGPVRFIDTAGMQAAGKEAEGAEYYFDGAARCKPSTAPPWRLS